MCRCKQLGQMGQVSMTMTCLPLGQAVEEFEPQDLHPAIMVRPMQFHIIVDGICITPNHYRHYFHWHAVEQKP